MHCSDATKIWRVCQFHHKCIFSFALIFTCQSLQGINAQLSLRDSCGARNYLLAVAHIISTAAPLLTSLYLPQTALSRKAASCAILTSLPDYSLSFFSSTKTSVRLCSVEAVLRCLTVHPSSRRLLTILGSTGRDLPLSVLLASDNIITFSINICSFH